MSALDLRELLVSCTWQTSACLLLGLAASALLARRPARAHVALLAAAVAALATPLASALGRAAGVGLLAPAEPGPLAGDLPGGMEPALGAVAGAPTVPVVLATLWALVSVVAVARLARGLRASRRLLAASRPAEDAGALAAAARAARALGLRTRPELLVSARVASPVVWCWSRRPRIVLPDVARGPGDLEPILCHELAHFARADHLSSLVGELLVCALPWNPLAHAVRRRLAAESERACDQWVLASGEAPARYAEALLGLLDGSDPAPAPPLALPAVGPRRSLARRLASILAGGVARPRAGAAFRALAVALALVVSAGLALAHRRAPEPRAPLDHVLASLPAELTRMCAAATPGLCVLPAELDLGRVEPGGVGAGSIWIANTGDVPRTLAGVKPSCGCVAVVDLAARVLFPGEVVELPLVMEAPETPGTEKRKKVAVLVEDDRPIEVELVLTTTRGDAAHVPRTR